MKVYASEIAGKILGRIGIIALTDTFDEPLL